MSVFCDLDERKKHRKFSGHFSKIHEAVQGYALPS